MLEKRKSKKDSMLQSEAIAKLSIAVAAQDIGSLLQLLASRYNAEIKDITQQPEDLETLQEEIASTGHGAYQDLSVQESKIRMTEKKLAEVNEHLDYIMKKLDISTATEMKVGYEFHVKDLDDLVEKLLEATGEIYSKVQENFNEQVNNEREIATGRQELAILESLSNFDFKHQVLDDLRFIRVEMVRISEKSADLFKKYLDEEQFYYYETKISEFDYFYIVPISKSVEADFVQKLDLYNARIFELKDEFFTPEGAPDIEGMNAKQQLLLQERKRIEAEMKQLKKEITAEVIAFYELFINTRRFMRYHEKMQFVEDVVISEFWIREADWPLLAPDLDRAFQDRIRYLFTPVKRRDAYQDENEATIVEQPPILIKIPKILQPFTTLLKLYGYPRYSELNPLILIFFTFPLLFGIMFGDIGQGFVLMIAGLLFAHHYQKRRGYHNFSIVVFWCGVGALIGGLFYGEIFGIGFGITLPHFNLPMTLIGVGIGILVVGIMFRLGKQYGANSLLYTMLFGGIFLMVLSGFAGSPSAGQLTSFVIFSRNDNNVWTQLYTINFIPVLAGIGFGMILGTLFTALGIRNKNAPVLRNATVVGGVIFIAGILCGIILQNFGFDVSHAWLLAQRALGRILKIEPNYIQAFTISPLFQPFVTPSPYSGIGDSIDLFKFSIWVGVILMSIGFLFRAYNDTIRGRKYMILVDVVPKLGILWTMWIVIVIDGLDISYFMSAAFFTSLPGILLIVWIVIFIFGQALAKLAPQIEYLQKKSVSGSIGEQSMEFFETFLSFLSNSVSFSRLFAMAMVHAGFMFACNEIALQISNGGSIILYGILYGVGTGLVMVLELLLVTIQNLRLHFYEFFSKFYDGGGKEFQPLEYDTRFAKLYFDNTERFITDLIKQSSPASPSSIPIVPASNMVEA